MKSTFRLSLTAAIFIANSSASAEDHMIDLAPNQCTIVVQDEETQATPKIDLKLTTVRPGRFFSGGKYLSSWTHEERKINTHVKVQMFKGDDGQDTISISLEVKDRTQRPGAFTAKYNQFVLSFDARSNLTGFKERLSYEVYKQDSYISVYVPGKSRYDGEFKTVHQDVESRDGRIQFTRSTETGLTVTANCSLR